MCLVEFAGSAVLEVFPNPECDDVREIRTEEVDSGDLLWVEVQDANDHGFSFSLKDGRSSAMVHEAVRVIEDCGSCHWNRV